MKKLLTLMILASLVFYVNIFQENSNDTLNEVNIVQPEQSRDQSLPSKKTKHQEDNFQDSSLKDQVMNKKTEDSLFSENLPVRERTFHLSLDESWQQIGEYLNFGDISFSDDVEDDFIIGLRKVNNLSIYDELESLFKATSSEKVKLKIASMLGKIATPKSASLLLLKLQNKEEMKEEITIGISNAILNLSNKKGRNKPNPKVASVIERHLNCMNDNLIYESSAIALAKIGEESSLISLIGKLRIDNIDSQKEKAILEAMNYVENEKLITTLSKNLQNNSENKLEEEALTGALSSIATVKATEVLLNWAVNKNAAEKDDVLQVFVKLIDKNPRIHGEIYKKLKGKKIDSMEIKRELKRLIIDYKNK